MILDTKKKRRVVTDNTLENCWDTASKSNRTVGDWLCRIFAILPNIMVASFHGCGKRPEDSEWLQCSDSGAAMEQATNFSSSFVMPSSSALLLPGSRQSSCLTCSGLVRANLNDPLLDKFSDGCRGRFVRDGGKAKHCCLKCLFKATAFSCGVKVSLFSPANARIR